MIIKFMRNYFNKKIKKDIFPKIINLVLTDNTGSKKIFQKNDYQLKRIWFEKELN